MHLFVSLPLDEPMRTHLGRIARGLFIEDLDDDARWVPLESLHVTLKFLGEVPDAGVPGVVDALKGVSSDLAVTLPRPIAIGPARIDLPSPHGRVHLIAAEIEDADGGVHMLAELVERALEPLGFRR